MLAKRVLALLAVLAASLASAHTLEDAGAHAPRRAMIARSLLEDEAAPEDATEQLEVLKEDATAKLEEAVEDPTHGQKLDVLRVVNSANTQLDKADDDASHGQKLDVIRVVNSAKTELEKAEEPTHGLELNVLRVQKTAEKKLEEADKPSHGQKLDVLRVVNSATAQLANAENAPSHAEALEAIRQELADRDRSMGARFSAISEAYDENIAPHMDDLYNRTSEEFEKISGQKAPRSGAVLGALVVLPPLLLAVPVVLLCRAYLPGITMPRILQSLHVAAALWCLSLVVAGEIVRGEPLGTFMQVAGKPAYIKFQFLAMAAGAALFALESVQLLASRGWLAFSQLVVFVCVWGHYYESIFQPAMHGGPPEPVLVPAGGATYLSYACAFLCLAGLAPPTAAERKREMGSKAVD